MPATKATSQDRPKKGATRKPNRHAKPDFTERMEASRASSGAVDAAVVRRQREAEASRAIDEFDRKWKQG
ncbi:hypothetical protein PG999_008265 [Apiospora kogelbergensis]|uniref:DUF3043 domain-containing protein n=1 Tax=Apiospora kogelbergensis TaxID=1337665 RepID=A0AAW0QIC8_9PEZI